MCLFLPFLTCLIVLFLMFILLLFISWLACFLLLTNDLIFRQRFIHLRFRIVSFESPGVLEPSGGTTHAFMFLNIHIFVHLLLFTLIYLHTYIMIFSILFIVGHVISTVPLGSVDHMPLCRKVLGVFDRALRYGLQWSAPSRMQLCRLAVVDVDGWKQGLYGLEGVNLAEVMNNKTA